MRRINSSILMAMLLLLPSCKSSNFFNVTNIVNGNSLRLSSGTVVVLQGVGEIEGNIKILEHYTRDGVLLYDENNEPIDNFSADRISAVVYNPDGDCVNDLLAKVKQIAPPQSPPPVENAPPSAQTVVHMNEQGGVYVVPVEINGVEMFFIFDTGASLISISSKAANDLFRDGKLSDSDIIGKGKFTDANGDISEGTIINIKSVKIGDRTLNDVKACVDNNQQAPLLLGQSALQKFGKISIDYNNHELIFE